MQVFKKNHAQGGLFRNGAVQLQAPMLRHPQAATPRSAAAPVPLSSVGGPFGHRITMDDRTPGGGV